MCFLCHSSAAHHSFTATFDIDKEIVVEGLISEFVFENPHVLIYLEVENADGSTATWLSQGDAASRFRLAGWSEDTLQLGDYLRVSGKGTQDNSPAIWIEQIELLDPNTGALIKELNPQVYPLSEDDSSESAN